MKVIENIVVIKDMASGNESVGEMWQETKIFNKGEPLINILKWAFPQMEYEGKSRKRVTITIPDVNE
jgi:hypothetical protein